MKRRSFLKTSIAIATTTGVASLTSTGFAATQRPRQREYYDFRAYRLKPGASVDTLHAYLKNAALPALAKIGAGPIGVFTEIESKDPATVFVLIPWPNLQLFAQGSQWVRNDSNAATLAPEHLEAPKDKPAFDRIDSWLLHAFAGMPELELADYSRKKADRIFELRTYESHSELKALRKIDMFNEGEMDVMREVGLAPVFFGEALTGPNLPHLTYMTSAANAAEHKKHWEAFGKHPKWEQMKNDPRYADTVSKITRWMLQPAPYSQI